LIYNTKQCDFQRFRRTYVNNGFSLRKPRGPLSGRPRRTVFFRPLGLNPASCRFRRAAPFRRPPVGRGTCETRARVAPDARRSRTSRAVEPTRSIWQAIVRVSRPRDILDVRHEVMDGGTRTGHRVSVRGPFARTIAASASARRGW